MAAPEPFDLTDLLEEPAPRSTGKPAPIDLSGLLTEPTKAKGGSPAPIDLSADLSEPKAPGVFERANRAIGSFFGSMPARPEPEAPPAPAIPNRPPLPMPDLSTEGQARTSAMLAPPIPQSAAEVSSNRLAAVRAIPGAQRAPFEAVTAPKETGPVIAPLEAGGTRLAPQDEMHLNRLIDANKNLEGPLGQLLIGMTQGASHTVLGTMTRGMDRAKAAALDAVGLTEGGYQAVLERNRLTDALSSDSLAGAVGKTLGAAATDLPLLVAGGGAGAAAVKSIGYPVATSIAKGLMAVGVDPIIAANAAARGLEAMATALPFAGASGAAATGAEVVKGVSQIKGGEAPDVVGAAGHVAAATAVGGVAGMIVPQNVLQAMGQGAAAVTAMTLATEGRLPTVQELAVGGISMGVIHAAFQAAGVPLRAERPDFGRMSRIEPEAPAPGLPEAPKGPEPPAGPSSGPVETPGTAVDRSMTLTAAAPPPYATGEAPAPPNSQVLPAAPPTVPRGSEPTAPATETTETVKADFTRRRAFGSAPIGERWTAATEAGQKVEGVYQVVPAQQLVASHATDLSVNPSFPAELQPRQRERAGYEGQIQDIAGRLDPSRLAQSPTVGQGAPIVDTDGTVESGNGRVIAIRRAYDQGLPTADHYKQWLIAHAEDLGLDPGKIAAITQPVLVRTRHTQLSPEGRQRFVQQANEGGMAQMSATEQAKVDAQRLTPDMLGGLSPDAEGNLNAASNRGFVRSWLASVPVAQQTALVDAQGALSAEGLRRMTNAVLAAAYPDTQTLERFSESTDNQVRGVGRGLLMAAPRIARMKVEQGSGAALQVDFVEPLLQAVNKLDSLRSGGIPVSDYLAPGLFEHDTPPLARDMLAFLDAYKSRPTLITEVLDRMVGRVEQLGHPDQASLFTGEAPPTAAELFEDALRGMEKAHGVAPPSVEAPSLQSHASSRGVGAGAAPGPAPEPAPAAGAGESGPAADVEQRPPRTAPRGRAQQPQPAEPAARSAPVGEFRLPRDLAGAKPRYRDAELTFDRDMDKALYILAQEKRSARDADYLRAVREYTEDRESEIRDVAREVKAAVGRLDTIGQHRIPPQTWITTGKPEPAPSRPAPGKAKLIPTRTEGGGVQWTAKPVETPAEPHKFSSTQINLPDALAQRIKQWAGANIRPEDLAEEGVETTPHVTVKYGLHTSDADDVARVLSEKGPLRGASPSFTVELGPMGVFSSPEHDVLFIQVQPGNIRRVNAMLARNLEVTDTHPEYKPHVTVAYLKPGTGEQYRGDNSFNNEGFTASAVLFTPKEGEPTTIPLETTSSSAPTLEITGDQWKDRMVKVIDGPDRGKVGRVWSVRTNATPDGRTMLEIRTQQHGIIDEPSGNVEPVEAGVKPTATPPRVTPQVPPRAAPGREETVRLYRGQGVPQKAPPEWVIQGLKASGAMDAFGRWFTDDPKIAEWYAVDAGESGHVTYVDVPRSVYEEAKVTKNPQALRFSRDAEHEFFLPKEYAQQARPLPDPEAEASASETEPYLHAERFRALVDEFETAFKAETLPTDAMALRKLAAKRLGLSAKDLGQDPAAVDDIHDALETAINRVYRANRPADAALEVQVLRAQRTEESVVNRVRTVEITKLQQFSTPLPLAEGAAYALDVRPGETVGEPTAGTGNLLAVLPPGVVARAVELDPRRVHALKMQGVDVTEGDALKTPLSASVIIANPPWGKFTTGKYTGAKIPLPYGEGVDLSERFVVKALRELPAGGRLSAVMPTTILQAPAFLKWLRTAHTLRATIQSPPGAYDSRGTTVDSVLLVVDKGVIPDAQPAINARPGDWADWLAALRPLSKGGSHSRPGSDRVEPADVGRGAGQPQFLPESAVTATVEREEPLGRESLEPDRSRAGGAGELAGAQGDVAGRRPRGRKPPAGVSEGVGAEGGPAVGGESPPAVVAGLPGRRSPEPGGPAGRLPSPSGGGAAADIIHLEGQRYAVADRAELDAAARSPIFAPAPLRSARGESPHPRLIVLTRSLSGAKLPDLTYEPKGTLVRDAYNRKVISDAQWDYGIIPALQAAEKGHWFACAADVGVGKSRVGAGFAAELLETGQANRILWSTASEVNIQDLKRELDLFAGGKWPYEVLQVTSFKDSSERGKKQKPEPLPVSDKTIYLIDRYNLAAYRKSLEELGFDAIIGDEAHLLKNIEGAAAGQAWFELQKQTIQKGGKGLYLTATPAVAFEDLEHFIGLKEWAPDGFADYALHVTGHSPEAQGDLSALRPKVEQLRAQVERQLPPDTASAILEKMPRLDQGFISHRELVDRHRTAIDLLTAALTAANKDTTAMVGGDSGEAGVTKKKSKSFLKGTDAFSIHVSPGEQEQIMRELATKGKYMSVDLWRAGVEFEVLTSPLTAEQKAEYAAMAAFFKKVNTAFMQFGRMNKVKKMFTIRHFLQQEAKRRMFDFRLDQALRTAKEALARGEQVVISTISVNETTSESGPIPSAINAINATSVEVDPDTKAIISEEEIPEALIARAELLDEWASIRPMANPIDRITAAFGKDNTAVITGAIQPKVREKMIEEFQAGTRRVAVISGAGKTGISLHHIVKSGKGSAGRRHLIVTDYEWSATTFKQELGRVDRSGQISAPKVTALSTGQAGEKKFLGTIANRMRGLGSLSKGSAETTGQLAEFELGGGLDTHAMRLAYRSLDPDRQNLFLSKAFRDPNSRDQNTRSYPQDAQLKDFLLDLQFMPVEDGDAAFLAFWDERGKLLEDQAAREEKMGGRTRSHEGTVLRSTELRPSLTLHEVEDTNGHRFGILQGLVTDHMTQIARFLEEGVGGPKRPYMTFRAPQGQISGLEIRKGSIAGLSTAFGKTRSQELRTPADVKEALAAGDKVPLQGAGGYVLRQRPSDKLIAIENAKMADRGTLQAHGASYSPAGNFWYVKQLELFLQRFPPAISGGSDAPLDDEGNILPPGAMVPLGGGGAGEPPEVPPPGDMAVGGEGGGPLADLHAMRVAKRGPSLMERLRGAKQRAIELNVNMFEPLRRVNDAIIQAGGALDLGKAPIEIAELTKNRTLGTTEAVIARLARIYAPIERAHLTQDFEDYLTLRQFEKRIRDLAARPESDVTPEGRTAAGGYVNPRQFDVPKIQEGLDALTQRLDEAQMAQIQEAAGAWWSVNRTILTEAHAVGLVSDAAYEAITARGEDYVPMQVLDYIGDVGDVRQRTQPYSVKYQDYLRRMEGTERDVRATIQASVDKAVKAVATIERNRAARALVDWQPLIPHLMQEFSVNQKPPAGLEVVSAYIDGKRKDFAVPPDIGRAMQFLDAEQIGLLGRMARIAAQPLRVGATGANLAFAIPNFFRDVTRMLTYNKYGLTQASDVLTLPLDFVRALYHITRGEIGGKQDAVYEDFLTSGAAFSTIQKNLTPERILRRAGHVRHVWDYFNLPKLMFNFAVELNSLIEETPKVASLLHAYRKGASHEEAAYEAANYGGSPNFARAGSLGRQLNLLLMFYNARLQGTAANYRRLTEDRSGRGGGAGEPPSPPGSARPGGAEAGPPPGGDHARSAAWLRMAILMWIPTVILWLWNQQFDDDHGLDEVSDTDQNRYNIILLPELYQHSSGQIRRKYLKIAKEETWQVTGPLIEAGLDYLKGKDPGSMGKLALETVGNLSPINMQFEEPSGLYGVGKDVGAGVLAGLNPALRVPTELLANYNARNKSAIVPRGMADNLLAEDQMRETTSPLVARVAKLVGMSPIKLEYAVDSWTGGLGQGVVASADRAMGKEAPAVATDYEAASRFPLASRFLGSSGGQQDRAAEERFYRHFDESTRALGSLNAAAKVGEVTRGMEIVRDPALIVQAELHGALQDISKQLGEIRQLQGYLVHRAGEVSVEGRQHALKAIEDARHEILEAYRMIEKSTDEFRQPLGTVPLSTPGRRAPARAAAR